MSSPSFPAGCEVLQNEELRKYCTLRVGGKVAIVAIPDCEDKLRQCIDTCIQANWPYRVLGKGSNTLGCDEGFDGVLIVTNRCRRISITGTCVDVECGVSLQQLLGNLQRNSLGGIEYLVSVPASVGGAIFSNAGRGEAFNLSIGQHVESVRVFDGNIVRRITRDECCFAHRQSIFQQRPNWVILGGTFRFDRQSPDITKRLLRERMDHVAKVQDRSHPNAGSVFKCGYKVDLRGVRVRGALFSSMTPNWIINDRGATSRDIEELLTIALSEHERRGLDPPVLEWQRVGDAERSRKPHDCSV